MTDTPTAVDHPPTTPPRWPRLVVVCALLPLGILGALALSAAATIDLAADNAVPVAVRPAAVAMLEVVSTAGTLLAIFARTARLRNKAMAGVAAASLVSLVAGLTAYGLFGVVAPLLLVWLVHLAAEAYQELRAEQTVRARQPAAEVVVPRVPERAAEVVDPEPDPFDQVPIGPVHGPATLAEDLRARPKLPTVRDLIDEVEWIMRKGEIVPCTRHFAHEALREARTGLSVVAS